MLFLDDLPREQFLRFLGQSRLTLRGATYSLAVRQHSTSKCWAVRHGSRGGEVVAGGGIRPVAPGAGEVWSLIDQGQIGGQTRALVWLTRDVLSRQAELYPGGLYSFCRAGSRGEKLNRLCLFVPTDVRVNDYRIWRFSPDELSRPEAAKQQLRTAANG
jgi:hypothetical protein